MQCAPVVEPFARPDRETLEACSRQKDRRLLLAWKLRHLLPPSRPPARGSNEPPERNPPSRRGSPALLDYVPQILLLPFSSKVALHQVLLGGRRYSKASLSHRRRSARVF